MCPGLSWDVEATRSWMFGLSRGWNGRSNGGPSPNWSCRCGDIHRSDCCKWPRMRAGRMATPNMRESGVVKQRGSSTGRVGATKILGAEVARTRQHNRAQPGKGEHKWVCPAKDIQEERSSCRSLVSSLREGEKPVQRAPESP